MSKIIITAAITGSVHIPTMSDYLPLTPDQIVEDAVKSYEAGAAIAHIHVRNPANAMPSPAQSYSTRSSARSRSGVTSSCFPPPAAGWGRPSRKSSSP